MAVHLTGRATLENMVGKALRRAHSIENRLARHAPASIYTKKNKNTTEAYAAVCAFNEEHGLSVPPSRTVKERVLRMHSNRKSKSKISLPGAGAHTSGVSLDASRKMAEANEELIASLKTIIGALETAITQMRKLGGKSTVSARHLVDAAALLRKSNRELS